MPYIRQDQRRELDPVLQPLLVALATNGSSGILNYIVTRVLATYQPMCYDDYNTLIGVLECAKLELYRRAIAPYEDKKVFEHGDVYPEA